MALNQICEIFFADSSGPQITFDPNQPTVTLRYPRFTWTSNETANFECSLDGFVQNIEQCGSGTRMSWQRSRPDGEYTLSVRGRDTNGNTGSPASHSFRVGKLSYQVSKVLIVFSCTKSSHVIVYVVSLDIY